MTWYCESPFGYRSRKTARAQPLNLVVALRTPYQSCPLTSMTPFISWKRCPLATHPATEAVADGEGRTPSYHFEAGHGLPRQAHTEGQVHPDKHPSIERVPGSTRTLPTQLHCFPNHIVRCPL